MNAFIAITNLIQLEIIANTKEGKYLQKFKKTVFVPLVWMALQFLEQSGPLDWSPLDLAGWATSTSWKSAAIALAISPLIMHKVLTESKPLTLQDWEDARRYPKLQAIKSDNPLNSLMSYLISVHEEQKDRIRNRKLMQNGIAPPVPNEPTRTDSDTSEITDTDDSTTVDQPQAKKRWADLFNETKAKVEKPVEEDNSKYTVFIPHILEIIKEQKRMAEQLTKLANLFDEQNKVIVSQSIILQEINSKLTVTEKHDSSPHAGVEEAKAPDSDLNAFQLDEGEKEQAMNNQEAADAKGRMMAVDESLAREIQRQDLESANVDKKVSFHTPFKEDEVTPREVSALFSGKKNL